MTTNAHHWNIASVSCDGFYGGQPMRVYRAKCKICGQITTFPVDPDAPICRSLRTLPSVQTVPPCTGSVVAQAEAVVASVPTAITRPETQLTAKKEETVSRTGVDQHARKAYYMEKKTQILADIKSLGVEAALKKWGIPHSTYRGWIALRQPDWKELWPTETPDSPEGVSTPTPIGTQGETVLVQVAPVVPPKQPKNHGDRHKSTICRDRMADLIRKWPGPTASEDYRRGCEDAARLVEVA